MAPLFGLTYSLLALTFLKPQANFDDDIDSFGHMNLSPEIQETLRARG